MHHCRVVWYRIGSHGAEIPIGALSGDLRPLGFGQDSAHQNTAEFIAATVGVLGALALGFSGASVILRGDSTSALCWCFRQKYKGTLTANAAVVFTLLLVRTGITVVDAEFVTSEENPICDALSRGVSVAEAVDIGLVPSGVGTVAAVEHYLPRLLAECSPGLDTDSDASFEGLWMRAGALVEAMRLPNMA